MPRTLSGKVLEVPVKRILRTSGPAKSLKEHLLEMPEAKVKDIVSRLEELARTLSESK